MRARELTLASLMSIVTGLSAQLCIYIGPIPYTLQNFGVVLSGLLLTPKYAMLAQSIYLWLIAVGAPLGAGFKGGVNVFLGPTAGYLMAFPIAAYLTSIFSRPLLKEGNRIKAWLVCTLTTSVIYILGITWLYFWLERFNGDIMMWMYKVASLVGVPNGNKLTIILLAGGLIFIPQDVLVDHVLAILVAYYVLRMELRVK